MSTETVQPTVVDELRAASKKIRDLAAPATPGPWGVGNGTTVARDAVQLGHGSFTALQAVTDTDMFDGREDWGDDSPEYVDVDPEADAAHIALWDPPAALLVADLLDKEAILGNTGPALLLARAINAKLAAVPSETPEANNA